MVGIHLSRSVPTGSSNGLISSQKTHALRLGLKKNTLLYAKSYRYSVRKRKKMERLKIKACQKDKLEKSKD